MNRLRKTARAPRVFLGGTCNGSQWRDELISLLEIDYFNPVVEQWDDEAQHEELLQRQTCDYLLYTITPKMAGVYSIAEVAEDSSNSPERTIFCILKIDGFEIFDTILYNSLKSVAKMVERNGGKVFYTLEDVANFLNGG